MGLGLMAIGALLLVIGALVWLGWLSWFGRLPGDIRIERPNTRVYIPITSMLLLSILLTVLLSLFRRLK
jgi:membrane protein implicated in regulation of membrane protease activity